MINSRYFGVFSALPCESPSIEDEAGDEAAARRGRPNDNKDGDDDDDEGEGEGVGHGAEGDGDKDKEDVDVDEDDGREVLKPDTLPRPKGVWSPRERLCGCPQSPAIETGIR